MTTITFDEADAGAVSSVIKSLSVRFLKLTLEKLMTQIDDLDAALNTAGADVTQILAILAADVQAIADENAQIAVLAANQAPDLTDRIAKVNAMIASMSASLPPPPAPAGTPVPAPDAPAA